MSGELETAITLARAAGARALEFYGARGLHVERKGFDEPVTEADYAANRIIIEAKSEICIKVGGNFVTIDKNGGVAIQGKPYVDINCDHSAKEPTIAGLECKLPDETE